MDNEGSATFFGLRNILEDEDVGEAKMGIGRLHDWGGPRLVQDMTAIFEVEAPSRLTDLAGAIDRRDSDTAARAAHSLKSSAGQIGALRLARLAGEVESLAEAGNVEAAGALVDDMEKHLSQFLAWLRDTGQMRGSGR